MKPALAVSLRLSLAQFELNVEFESNARCLGLFGPSGSGKTSLLEAIAGWRRDARGRVAVAGHVLSDSATGARVPLHGRGIGYVPQDALLFPHWNVERNLRAHRRPQRASNPGDAEGEFERAVDMLGLGDLLRRSTDTLSGGERQRVALARALISRPALLLFDEPLGGVDVSLRRRILPWLVRLRDAVDVPIVFVSHDPTEVQVLCDEVIALERGQVCARGAPAATLRALFSREERFENVLEGRVVHLGASTARVNVGGVDSSTGVEIHVTRGNFDVGQRVAFALGSDDVLLALTPPAGLSARNVIPCVVESIEVQSHGSRVDLRLAPGALGAPGTLVQLSATVSAEAIAQLGIAPGLGLYAVFKSSSCQLLSPQERE